VLVKKQQGSIMSETNATKQSYSEFNHPADIAHQIESLPENERDILWSEVPVESRGDVLPYLHENLLQNLLEQMPTDEISIATESMDTSERADVIDLLSNEVAQEVIDSLSEQDKNELDKVLQYDNDEAGRLVDHQVLTVTSKRTVKQLLTYIRSHKLPRYTDKIFIIGAKRLYLGAIALGTLLEADENAVIKDLPLVENLDLINPTMELTDVAAIFRQKHYVSLPVVTEQGILLGRITLDDAMELIQDESDHQLMSLAGLSEDEDLFAPIISSSKRRAVWLGINLMTAFLASWVIGFFEATLEQVVALAILMPVVASMGGIAGSQTLTMVIRGFALKQVHSENQQALLYKELKVGLINGVVWAIVVGLVTTLWFQNPALGIIIALAIIINIVTAAGAGIMIPVLLKKVNIDPALSGSVILTTVTDVVGFLCFLGFGTLWLL
jgi:magnesium transporter